MLGHILALIPIEVPYVLPGIKLPYQQICSFSYCFRTMPDAILQEVKEVDPETMVEARPVPSLVNATSTKLDRSIS
eukprot:c27409_g2_i2 orf=720-947(+)